ncbi:MAG: hypothetical protein WCJ42_08985 [Actinomycetes bacterium]
MPTPVTGRGGSGRGATTPGPWRCAWALLSLRWRMVRKRRHRIGLAVAGLLAPSLLGLALPLSQHLPPGADPETALALAGAIFFAVAAIAPLAAGGGYQLFPPDQVAGLAVTAPTMVRSSVLLTPLNLAWYAQTVGLVTLTFALHTAAGATLALLALIAAWVSAATIVGQAIAWTIAGVRRSSRGRLASWVLLALVIGLVFFGRSQLLNSVLAGPGRLIALTRNGQLQPALTAAALLTVLAWLGIKVADRACAWTIHRRTLGTQAGPTDQQFGRRSAPATPYRALLRSDRASVWRSAPLRRGLLVLGLLPAVAAGLARLDWPSLALLPAFVGSGAALLFGVNAFCLVGGGAVWLSTIPQNHRLTLYSKAQVMFETTGLAVAVGMSGGLLRARFSPDRISVAATLASVLVATTLVMASCLRLSVVHPHRADLLGSRDTPAPPGAMALYAARLTALAGIPAAAFSIFARLQVGWPVLVSAVLLLTWAGMSIRGTIRRWDDPMVRANVAATVASG